MDWPCSHGLVMAFVVFPMLSPLVCSGMKSIILLTKYGQTKMNNATVIFVKTKKFKICSGTFNYGTSSRLSLGG